MRFRKYRAEDRGQKLCRGHAAHTQQPARSADNNLSSVFCPLSSERGFTLIELIVTITIIVVLASVFLTRVQYYQELAEKANMQQVAGVLQSALTMKHGHLMARDLDSEVPALAVENPMRWLAKVPVNYAGEFYDVTPRLVAPGNWVFDLKTRNLIYVVGMGDHFTPDKDGHKWVRFHVNVLHETVPDSKNNNPKELVGILFQPVAPYQWFE